MKGKIIIPTQNKNYNLVSCIVSFIIGIVLVTNSNSIVTIAFQLIGAIILLYGIYNLIQFFNIRKQFKTEDNNALMSGIISITIGLLIILLAGVLEIGLRYIIGLFLIINGVSKLNIALILKKENNKNFITSLIVSIILIIFGLHTIFVANAALIIIGILLILSAVFDLIKYVSKK